MIQGIRMPFGRIPVLWIPCFYAQIQCMKTGGI